MLYKICSNCKKRIQVGKSCGCRHKEYDREHRNNINSKFYNSREWRRIREVCLIKANYLDEYELCVNNRIVKGSVIHHIIELEEDKTKALDLNNLICVSAETHNYLHAQYKKNKKSMQKKLFEIKEGVGKKVFDN